MAIDIRKGSHIKTFPSDIASMMGQYGHVYDIQLTADTDNGTLAGRGDYVSFHIYEQGDAPKGFAGVIREQAPDGTWYIEVTAVPSDAELLYIYNAPVSEYGEREFQDETLFYNKEGEVAQGATLIVGDWFAISKEGFTGTPSAGKSVTYASGKYVVGA